MTFTIYHTVLYWVEHTQFPHVKHKYIKLYTRARVNVSQHINRAVAWQTASSCILTAAREPTPNRTTHTHPAAPIHGIYKHFIVRAHFQVIDGDGEWRTTVTMRRPGQPHANHHHHPHVRVVNIQNTQTHIHTPPQSPHRTHGRVHRATTDFSARAPSQFDRESRGDGCPIQSRSHLL